MEKLFYKIGYLCLFIKMLVVANINSQTDLMQGLPTLVVLVSLKQELPALVVLVSLKQELPALVVLNSLKQAASILSYN
jgi:hypothetical protein